MPFIYIVNSQQGKGMWVEKSADIAWAEFSAVVTWAQICAIVMRVEPSQQTRLK